MPRVRPRTLIVPGLAVAAAGMALLTQLSVSSGYFSVVLPAELLIGFGISCAMVPSFSIATLGVDRRDAGVAAAAVNTAQQVGASIGTALLNTLAASATIAYVATHTRFAGGSVALVHGYAFATGWGAATLLVGAVLALGLVNARKPAPFSVG